MVVIASRGGGRGEGWSRTSFCVAVKSAVLIFAHALGQYLLLAMYGQTFSDQVSFVFRTITREIDMRVRVGVCGEK